MKNRINKKKLQNHIKSIVQLSKIFFLCQHAVLWWKCKFYKFISRGLAQIKEENYRGKAGVKPPPIKELTEWVCLGTKNLSITLYGKWEMANKELCESRPIAWGWKIIRNKKRKANLLDSDLESPFIDTHANLRGGMKSKRSAMADRTAHVSIFTFLFSAIIWT